MSVDYSNDFIIGDLDSLEIYINDVISKKRRVSSLKILIQEKQNGDPKAKELLINSYLTIVIKIAKEYEGRGLELLDLIQEGNIGLIEAIETFYPYTSYNEFIIYVKKHIRKRIKKAIEDQGSLFRIPTKTLRQFKLLTKTQDIFMTTNGYEASWNELADILDIDIEKIKALLIRCTPPLYLDEMLPEERELYLSVNQTTDTDIIFNEVLNTYIRKKVDDVLDTVTPREATIIKLRYGLIDGEPKTFEEIGNIFNLSRERIRQIEVKALTKLRHPSRSKSLKYLV